MQHSTPTRDAPWATANGGISDSSTERGTTGPGDRHAANPPDTSGDLVEPLTQALNASKRIAAIEWARAKLALRRQRRALLWGLYEIVLILALGVTGTIALLLGILGGLSDWLDSPWGGKLLGGILILAVAIAIPVITSKRRDRAKCKLTQDALCVAQKETP